MKLAALNKGLNMKRLKDVLFLFSEFVYPVFPPKSWYTAILQSELFSPPEHVGQFWHRTQRGSPEEGPDVSAPMTLCLEEVC